MTLVMYGPSLVRQPRVDILQILGRLFIRSTPPALGLGAVLHLVSGAVFASMYAFFWRIGPGAVRWWWGLIYGAAHGLLANAFMSWLLPRHPSPPHPWKLANKVVYVVAHFVFGTLVAALYKAQR